MERRKTADLSNQVTSEQGNIVGTAVGATMLAGLVGATYGLAGGIGGYIFGHIVEVIPYVNQVTPWVAHASGLIEDTKQVAEFHPAFYQTSGAMAGLWFGVRQGFTWAWSKDPSKEQK